MDNPAISTKSRLATLLLCFFLGWAGAHRFYVNKIGTGVMMLLSGGGLGIWWLVDIIFVVSGAFRDKEDKRVLNWFEPTSS